MGRLPISRANLNGALPSANVLEGTDMGLGALGDALSRHDASERRIGAKQAQDALERAEADYGAQYAHSAAAYTGEAPGFAEAQGRVLDMAYAKAREGLSDEAGAIFDQQGAERKVRYLGQAQAHEGQVLGGIVRQQAHAAQTARVLKSAQDFSLAQAGVTDADRHNGDTMLMPDYLDNRLQRFDAAAKELIDATPEFDRAALQGQLTQQRAEVQSSLYAEGFQLREQQTQANVTEGLRSIYNRVSSDPAYAGQAMVDAQKLTSALPVGIREKAQARIANDVLSNVAQGLQARDDLYGLEGFLARPEVKAGLDEKVYGHYQTYVTGQAAQAAQLLQQDTVSEAMENELVTITQTGQSSGFDPASLIKAYGPVRGPVMAQQFRRMKAEAESDYQLVTQAAGLSSAEITARLDILKPEAGDADFAAKQKRYERAMAQAQGIVTARLNDPAGFDARTTDSQALWLKAESGQPGAGQAWAAATLKRQAHWGIAEAQRSVLPVQVAKGMAQDIQKAPPERKDEVMAQTAQRLAAFGPYEGLALRDLQMAGLDSRDAAILNASNGDPVMLGTYSRLTALASTKKLSKDEADQLTDRVMRESGELMASFSYSTDAAAYADNLTQAMTGMAKGYMAQGESASDAAKLAVKAVASQYMFHNTGWRMPRSIGAQPTHTGGASNGMGEAAIGAYNLQRALVADPARLFAGPDPVLTPEQARAREAGRVADGRWVNTDDDGGLQLVVKGPSGGFRPVLDAQGRPVIATWDQLRKAAATQAEAR